MSIKSINKLNAEFQVWCCKNMLDGEIVLQGGGRGKIKMSPILQRTIKVHWEIEFGGAGAVIKDLEEAIFFAKNHIALEIKEDKQ